MTNCTDFFDGAEIISTYSRADAIDDGVLVDANRGDLDEVSRRHFKYPIAMTAAVFELMRKAVEHPHYLNDYKGVWHDICHMSKYGIVKRFDPTCHLFKVVITGTVGKGCRSLNLRRDTHTLKMHCGPGDHAEPVLTVMMPEED